MRLPIRTFLKQNDCYFEKYKLKGLDSTKFLQILHSNKTPNKFSTRQLKIAFKHPNFVREAF